jgi:hypothetical protein
LGSPERVRLWLATARPMGVFFILKILNYASQNEERSQYKPSFITVELFLNVQCMIYLARLVPTVHINICYIPVLLPLVNPIISAAGGVLSLRSIKYSTYINVK